MKNNTQSIGIVEIDFYAHAVYLLDQMLKAADVELVGCQKVLGGRMVHLIVGCETGAVEAAVQTAQMVGDQLGGNCLKVAIAIHNPHREILRQLNL